MAIRRTDLLFGGVPVYTDDDMPVDRVDCVAVGSRRELKRTTLLVNLAAVDTTITHTSTRPLKIGEWPWDQKGNAR